MSSFIFEQKGKHTYIVESIPYYNKNLKKGRSKKNYIGKIDEKTGNLIFKERFLFDTKLTFIIIKGQKYDLTKYRNQNKYNTSQKRFKFTKIDTIEDDEENKNSISETIIPYGTLYGDIEDQLIFGPTYLLQNLGFKCNLINILQIVFPKTWTFIFNLLLYIILENKKMSHCQSWVDENYTYNEKNMSSQNISELFNIIKYKERMLFFKNWIKITKEDEYIALDTTGIATNSSTNEESDFGHKKIDNKKLPQVNLCMLFGENSYLPMYQTTYTGSLTDVDTLKTTLNDLNIVFEDNKYKLVMDRGFYSADNINFMLSLIEMKFIIGVPFTTNYAKEAVNIIIKDIENLNNYIKTTNNGDIIKGIKLNIIWEKGIVKFLENTNIILSNNQHLLYCFVTYNKNKAMREEKKFLEKVNDIKNGILNKQKTIYRDNRSFIDEYIIIEYYKETKEILNIKINENNAYNHLYYSGYSVYISNHDLNITTFYDYYVKKDAVEKSFHNFKEYLGLDRPYVHGSKRMINKSFIIMLAQILYFSVHKVLLEKNLLGKISIPKIFKILKSIKYNKVGDLEYIKPLSKKQKDIFEIFSIVEPSFKL
jgi:transposase